MTAPLFPVQQTNIYRTLADNLPPEIEAVEGKMAELEGQVTELNRYLTWLKAVAKAADL